MKFYITLIIAMLGVGLVTSTVFAQDEINYTEMIEDLKVMCRIIDETMDETFEKDYLKGGFFRRGCQHLYLTGYGPVFLLYVQFPVSEKEMRVVKTEKETNLWEKYEREVRHQGQPEEAVWVVGKNESYSREKVDKLKEQLTYLAGEYGSRIGQLGFDDTISFVVFGHSDYAVDLDVGLDFETLNEHLKAKRESLKKLKETAEKLEELKAKIAARDDQEDDKKVIIQRDETIIIEEEKDEEMEDSQPKKGKQLRVLMRPTPPSFPHRFHGKPATTLVLTFKRSQLEGKKGTDWETLLAAAEVVEY